jgi:hypothetical protein
MRFSTNTSSNRATFSRGHASFPEATFSGPQRVLGSPGVERLCVRLESG